MYDVKCKRFVCSIQFRLESVYNAKATRWLIRCDVPYLDMIPKVYNEYDLVGIFARLVGVCIENGFHLRTHRMRSQDSPTPMQLLCKFRVGHLARCDTSGSCCVCALNSNIFELQRKFGICSSAR